MLTPPRDKAKKYVPTVYYDTFIAHPVALKIKSGDRVVTTTVDDTGVGADGQAVAKVSNPQTGPFFIEGAEPGDMIVVSIEKLEPNRLSGLSPSFMAANLVCRRDAEPITTRHVSRGRSTKTRA